MYKLVVLFAAVATATAAPSTLVAHHGLTAYATPAIHTFGADAVPVVAATPVAVESKVVESPTVVETRTSVGYAPAAALTKQVHYAAQPVVTGYSSSVIKPDLGALATPVHSVLQQQVLAPSRAVHTIVPQVTHVQPELHVRKVAVDVPVETPYVSKVEVHTPHVVAKTAPVIATHHVSNYVAAAPVLSTHVHNIPAVTSYAHGYAHGYAAPALYSLGYSTGYAAGVPTVY